MINLFRSKEEIAEEKKKKDFIYGKDKKKPKSTNKISSITDPNNVFLDVGILSLTVDTEERITTYPVENGMILSDNVVRLQNKITADVACGHDRFDDIYKNIMYARDNHTLFSIQSKVDTYHNMMITRCSYRDSAKVQDAFVMTVSFVERQTIKSKTYHLVPNSVLNKSDADTPPKSSIIYKPKEGWSIGSFMKKMFGGTLYV